MASPHETAGLCCSFRKIFTDIDVARYFEYDTTCLSMFGTAPRYDMQANNTFILKVDQPLKNVVFSIGMRCCCVIWVCICGFNVMTLVRLLDSLSVPCRHL